MTIENWLVVGELIVDLLKTLIPFGTLFFLIWLFKDDIKKLIKRGGLKFTAPGFSIEALEKQQTKLDGKMGEEIKALNSELKTSNLQKKRLLELQQYTAKDKDTFFLGYHFEKTYRLIFPSQMVILNTMSSNKNEVAEALISAIFQRTVWSQQFNVPYQQFIGFLIHSGLIAKQVNKYTLTPLGVTFLRYLNNNNIPLKIPANDIVIPYTQ